MWKIVLATLILMAIGSATRVMNAGLACPDWPLCYGELVPTQQMNLQVFLEWFHRLDAALIGISAIALTGISWWNHRSLPKWLPWASTFALSLIVFQGVLGLRQIGLGARLFRQIISMRSNNGYDPQQMSMAYEKQQ